MYRKALRINGSPGIDSLEDLGVGHHGDPEGHNEPGVGWRSIGYGSATEATGGFYLPEKENVSEYS